MTLRSLIILAVVTVLMVIAAGFAASTRQSANQAAFDRQPLFPGVKARVEEIASVTLETGQTIIVAERNADGGWVVPSRGGWNANFGTVRKTVLALTNLDALELRTARAANHSLLGVAALGEEGEGVQVTLRDASGNIMAALVSGKVHTSPDGTRAGKIYVRRADEDQVYLAQGDAALSQEIATWLDRALFDIAAVRIMSVETTPPVGRTFQVRRDTPDDEFAISDIPEGKEPILPNMAQSLAETVVLLALEDVRPAAEVDFSETTVSVHRMFDGMVLTTRAVKRDDGRWAKFEASFDAAQATAAADAGMIDAHERLMDAAEVQAMVAEINARTAGWAFKLPGLKGTDLLRDFHSLFKTKAPAGPAE